MVKKLKVTQYKSAIARPRDQKETVIGLGIKRLHHTVFLNDTPAIRGMLKKIPHLVQWEAVEIEE